MISEWKEKSNQRLSLWWQREIFNPCGGLLDNSAVNYSINVEDLLDACTTNVADSVSKRQKFYSRTIDSSDYQQKAFLLKIWEFERHSLLYTWSQQNFTLSDNILYINRSFLGVVKVTHITQCIVPPITKEGLRKPGESSPETTIDDQQNWYNNRQYSRTICKGVDPRREEKSACTCLRHWISFIVVLFDDHFMWS